MSRWLLCLRLKRSKSDLPEVPVICLTKGIETESLMMMSEVLEDVLGKERPMAYLSGPSFAMEIAQGLATAVTIASSDRDLGNDVMSLLKSRQFRGLCALARAPQPHPAARCAPSPLGPCRA